MKTLAYILREQEQLIRDALHSHPVIPAMQTNAEQIRADVMKLVSVMRNTLDDCPLGCLYGDCGAEWEPELKPCPICTPIMKVLADTGFADAAEGE